MNLRPSGYEPDELPDCSTPRQFLHYGDRPGAVPCLLASDPRSIRRADCPTPRHSVLGRSLGRRGPAAGGHPGSKQRAAAAALGIHRSLRDVRPWIPSGPGPLPRTLAHALGRSGGDLLSHALRRSTIGAEGFHGRVRDGIGCGPLAVTTRPSKRTGKTQGPANPLGGWIGVCLVLRLRAMVRRRVYRCP